MWLNQQQISDVAIQGFRKSLKRSCPNHIVIDDLFTQAKLDEVLRMLKQSHDWQPQKHTYSALYVSNTQWQKTNNAERFVRRDVWRRNTVNANTANTNNFETNIAQDFLSYLRGNEFMTLLSAIFKVPLTDINVARPEINTNYFRLGPKDFVCEHADDSPGREVCMLLYLNKEWNHNAGGELIFNSNKERPVSIAPLHNRCVLFDPSSEGSEHWVKKLNCEFAETYRYNVTSWYWSE
ncbi:2OG-Fe(II) oxygenase [uncultured Paraglaciecola sp.]|uniref:2OG-Fe(II) oxygenase n=1 Tax=uncultured Paraglaciecola sp. TaxID=1765024 RepID=UPI0030D6F5D7|tara:strand:- start:62678 stop:63388 length:711 start_codon:yes stop_codon:yes gene_type:complete